MKTEERDSKRMKKGHKEEEEEKKNSVAVLPWMRSPIDVDSIPKCPLDQVPLLDKKLVAALQSSGIASLFPVQLAVWQETIGPGSFERDLCINSPTGSGKTLAYALPVVQVLSTRSVKYLRALVVLPTRDLALQVKEVFNTIAPAVGLSVGLAVGQSSIADEISELIKRPKLEAGVCYDPEDLSDELQSSVDILVATPGRLMDHINNTKGFTLEHLCYLVVDETDRLLREAYQSWLPTVLQLTRSSDGSLFPRAKNFLHTAFGSVKTTRRTGVERGFKGKSYPRLVKMILSATLTQDPSKLAQLELHHPLFMTAGKMRYQFPEQMELLKVTCEPNCKPLYLVALLQSLHGEKSIVFTSSVDSTHRLCALLKFFGDLNIKIKEYSGLQRQAVRRKADSVHFMYMLVISINSSCLSLSDQLKSDEGVEYIQQQNIEGLQNGEVQVLVSSDAMTRGMDVEGVRNVINYDTPPYIKTFIHRAGRTARAGLVGRCFTLLHNDEARRFKKILQKADNSSYSVHSIAPDSLESLRSVYTSALEKLKESVESEAYKKRKAGIRSSHMGKRY